MNRTELNKQVDSPIKNLRTTKRGKSRIDSAEKPGPVVVSKNVHDIKSILSNQGVDSILKARARKAASTDKSRTNGFVRTQQGRRQSLNQ